MQNKRRKEEVARAKREMQRTKEMSECTFTPRIRRTKASPTKFYDRIFNPAVK